MSATNNSSSISNQQSNSMNKNDQSRLLGALGDTVKKARRQQNGRLTQGQRKLLRETDASDATRAAVREENKNKEPSAENQEADRLWRAAQAMLATQRQQQGYQGQQS